MILGSGVVKIEAQPIETTPLLTLKHLLSMTDFHLEVMRSHGVLYTTYIAILKTSDILKVLTVGNFGNVLLASSDIDSKHEQSCLHIIMDLPKLLQNLT